MINTDICKRCYLINGWDAEPLRDGRWASGVYCIKSKRWLECWKDLPENCPYALEHLVLKKEDNIDLIQGELF